MPNYPQAKAWRRLAAYYYKDCEDISFWKMAKHTGIRAWLQGVGHTASTSSFPHFNYGWLEARCCHRPQIKLKYDKAEISGPGLLQAWSHVRRRYSAHNYSICQYFFDGGFNMDMNESGEERHEDRSWHMIKSTFHFALPMENWRHACSELPWLSYIYMKVWNSCVIFKLRDHYSCEDACAKREDLLS